MEPTWPVPGQAQEEQDDSVLLLAVADGDGSALQELYERHSPWLVARLMRRCNDEDVVVDVVQDTFVTLWRDARKFRGEGEGRRRWWR